MKLRIGSRPSPLALRQAEMTKQEIARVFPDVECEIVRVVSEGDKAKTARELRWSGKGAYVRNLQHKLLSGEIDIAVHSSKDLPAETVEGISVAAALKRASVCDMLISEKITSLDKLRGNFVIATSSIRRRAFLKLFDAHLRFVDIKGNIDTRLKKLRTGEFDAIVLAAAGIQRLFEKLDVPSFEIPVEVLPPAPGQGTICIEARNGNQDVLRVLYAISDKPSMMQFKIEYSILQAVGGSCNVPLSIYAEPASDGFIVRLAIPERSGKRFSLEQKISAADLGNDLDDFLSKLKRENISRKIAEYEKEWKDLL